MDKKESKSKQKPRAGDNRYHVDYPAMSNVASGMETTGLMTTPPQSQEEFDSLLDNAGIQTPREE